MIDRPEPEQVPPPPGDAGLGCRHHWAFAKEELRMVDGRAVRFDVLYCSHCAERKLVAP